MTTLSDDWRAGLDEVDAALIDDYQSGFPVEARPFRAVAEDLGIDEEEALERVRRLQEDGIFRRFGAVLNPPVIGSSTLAAVSREISSRLPDMARTIRARTRFPSSAREAHSEIPFSCSARDMMPLSL